MAFYQRLKIALFPAILVIFSWGVLADLDPEITSQITKADSALTKNENKLSRSKKISVERTSKFPPSTMGLLLNDSAG